MLKYKHIFEIKYTEAILSNSTRKPLWFEVTKLQFKKNKFIVLFIIIFGTLSFPIVLHILYTLLHQLYVLPAKQTTMSTHIDVTMNGSCHFPGNLH